MNFFLQPFMIKTNVNFGHDNFLSLCTKLYLFLLSMLKIEQEIT